MVHVSDHSTVAVSYTHLDVYKRQLVVLKRACRNIFVFRRTPVFLFVLKMTYSIVIAFIKANTDVLILLKSIMIALVFR